VAKFVDLYPSKCESCWVALPQVEDPWAKRYQFTELDPLVPCTTEYRRHGVVCPHCGYRTMAAYDEERPPTDDADPGDVAYLYASTSEAISTASTGSDHAAQPWTGLESPKHRS
jgi:hypothetical protein